MIGPAQPLRAGGAVGGVGLGPEVDLLTPVDFAIGQLTADSRVAAKVWAAREFDRQLFLAGQGKEFARHGVQFTDQLRRHTMFDEVEESSGVGDFTEQDALLGTVEKREVHHRQHGWVSFTLQPLVAM
ncbi:hypothetical protein A5671_08030 [Mycolicibacter heraklionensis]|nr:hypothetical protein A5671_08030 [Mycolicibacter heraklionensis]